VAEPFHKIPMRNQQRQIDDESIMFDLLSSVRYVTLGLSRDDHPYVITLSCGLDIKRRALYFHTAIRGLKLDLIEANNRVSFTAIEDLGYQFGHCAHHFRSVVGFGKMLRVTDREEMRHAFKVMMDQLEPEPDPLKKKFLDKESIYGKTAILRLDIEHLTGKESKA